MKTPLFSTLRKSLLVPFLLAILQTLTGLVTLNGQCPTHAPSQIITPNTPYCYGDQIMLTAQANHQAVPPLTYEWYEGNSSNGPIIGTSQSITVTIVQGVFQYRVDVIDANGCIFPGHTNVYPGLWFSNLDSGPPNCGNFNTLSIHHSLHPPGPFFYLWSTGETTESITAERGETYSVTVSDVNGCTKVFSAEADFHPLPELTLEGPAELCADIEGEITVVQSNPDIWHIISIDWSIGTNGPGSSPESRLIPGPGTYSVTVTTAPAYCTGTASTVISETPPIPPIIDHPVVLCPDVEGQATVTNATQYAELNWVAGGSGPQIPVFAGNIYYLNSIEPNGCESQANFSVNEHPVIPPTIVAPPDICEGQEALDLVLTSSYEEYLWSTGETTSIISTNSVGTYSVTATDQNGCMDEGEINLVAAELPEPTVPSVSAVCEGGTHTLEVSNGPFETYVWSNSDTTESIEVNVSGTYSVTVSNARGCTGEDEAEVLISEGPKASIVKTEDICEGTTELTASGGVFYEWSTGDTTATLNVNTNGEYLVTVTDDEGCTDSISTEISMSVLPQLSMSGPNSFCEGTSVTLTANGSFTEYAWSNGESGDSISVSQGGTYTVTATDANGCTDVSSLSTMLSLLPEPQIIAPGGFCTGESAEIQLDSSYTNILWSNLDTISSITVTQAGSYAVTVTNSSGCSASGEVQIEEYMMPSAAIAGPSSVCTGSSIELSVDDSFSEFLWSTNDTTAAISVSEPGDYNITVTNANGCTATNDISLEASSSLEPQLSMEMENCEPLANLSAGSGYTEYIWSNGADTESITVEMEGEYTVTVSDNNGCSGEAMVEVNFVPAPVLEISGPNSVCEGEMAQLSADAGFESFQWSNGETTPDISVSQGGEYTLVATNLDGCTAEASFSLDVLALPSANISGPSTFCEGSTADLAVNGNFSNIQWNTSETDSNITISESGEYSVTVTDANGCSSTDSWLVETGTSLELEVGVTIENCTSNATLSVGGGFVDIQWSNGQTSETIEVSEEDIYQVTVTDASGCSGETTAEVVFNEPPVINLTGPNAACEGTATLLTANTGFDSYLWSTGETTSDILLSQPGEYVLVATDANGCTAEATHTFEFSAPPNAELNGPTGICTGGFAEFVVTGDFTDITWSNGANTPSIEVTEPGEYIATVTSSEGCIAEVSQMLTVGDELSPAISIDIDSCVATASLDAGSGYESYVWSNGQTSQTIEIFNDGSYTVTVSDATECTGEDVTAIVLPTQPTVEISGPAELCEGYEILLSAPSDFVDYTWSNGEATSEITVSAGGDYSLIATNADGCTAEAEWTVVELSTIHTELLLQTCNTQDTGTVVLSLTSQTGCDSVVTMVTNLVPAITTNLTVNACAGEVVEYAGLEMQAGEEAQFNYPSFEGCDSIVTVSVVEWPNISLEMEATASCWNTDNGSLSLNVTSGEGPILFSLDGGAFQAEPMFENLPTGAYTLTAEDTHGCIVEQEFEIAAIERNEIKVNDGLLRCDDGTALVIPEVLSGNPDMIDWQWSNGQTTMELETSQAGTFELTANDGCEEQTFRVSVKRAEDDLEGFFFVPNSFSPNDDGTNDIFKAYAGPQTQIRSFDFKVFDRWGNNMFGTSNINDGWDGYFQNNDKQIDVFAWYLKATVEGCRGEDVEIFREGGVHLMK